MDSQVTESSRWLRAAVGVVAVSVIALSSTGFVVREGEAALVTRVGTVAQVLALVD